MLWLMLGAWKALGRAPDSRLRGLRLAPGIDRSIDRWDRLRIRQSSPSLLALVSAPLSAAGIVQWLSLTLGGWGRGVNAGRGDSRFLPTEGAE